MTREELEQLAEAMDHLDQARVLLQDLSESLEPEEDPGSPDDEPSDAADASEELFQAAAAVEDLLDSLDVLREEQEGSDHD